MADAGLKQRTGRGWGLAYALPLVLAAVLLSLPGCGTGEQAGKDAAKDKDKPRTVALEIKGETFNLELALDPESFYQGLSDRKTLAKDGGMLFVFPEPEQGVFVMRRCYVPIDLIFVYEDGVVDSVQRMEVVTPIEGAEWESPSKKYSSRGAVKYAIELKGGEGGALDRLKIKKGDKIKLTQEVLQLKPR